MKHKLAKPRKKQDVAPKVKAPVKVAPEPVKAVKAPVVEAPLNHCELCSNPKAEGQPAYCTEHLKRT